MTQRQRRQRRERAQQRQQHQQQGGGTPSAGAPASSSSSSSSDSSASGHSAQKGNSTAATSTPVGTCGICFDSFPIYQLDPFGAVESPSRHRKQAEPSSVTVGASFLRLEAAPATSTPTPPPPTCAHRFCRPCTRRYLTHAVEEGQVLQIRCPGRQCTADGDAESPDPAHHHHVGAPCLSIAPSTYLSRHLGAATYQRYERCLKLKLDADYRSCPNRACLHVQKRRAARKGSGGDTEEPTTEEVEDEADAKNRMECEKCRQRYCFRHDLAHPPDVACAEYEKTQQVENARSLAAIAQSSVRCPNKACRVPTTKIDGCNYMQCTRCRTEYCYACRGLYLHGEHACKPPRRKFGGATLTEVDFLMRERRRQQSGGVDNAEELNSEERNAVSVWPPLVLLDLLLWTLVWQPWALLCWLTGWFLTVSVHVGILVPWACTLPVLGPIYLAAAIDTWRRRRGRHGAKRRQARAYEWTTWGLRELGRL